MQLEANTIHQGHETHTHIYTHTLTHIHKHMSALITTINKGRDRLTHAISGRYSKVRKVIWLSFSPPLSPRLSGLTIPQDSNLLPPQDKRFFSSRQPQPLDSIHLCGLITRHGGLNVVRRRKERRRWWLAVENRRGLVKGRMATTKKIINV